MPRSQDFRHVINSLPYFAATQSIAKRQSRDIKGSACAPSNRNIGVQRSAFHHRVLVDAPHHIGSLGL